MALLFGLLWLPWQQLTWAANAVSGNGRAVRLIFLVATAASVPMAASTSTALEEGGPVFAATLAVIMALGFFTQTLGVERGTVLYRSVVRWQPPNVAALAVLVAGAFVDGEGRTVLWLLSAAIVLAAMIAAGRGDWIVRSGHFAERHGLIVIIALGEVVVAIGLPVVQALEAGDGIPGRTVVALAASGVFAGLLWWAYFDRVGPALEHRAERHRGGTGPGPLRAGRLHVGPRPDRRRHHPRRRRPRGDHVAPHRRPHPCLSADVRRRARAVRGGHRRRHLAGVPEASARAHASPPACSSRCFCWPASSTASCCSWSSTSSWGQHSSPSTSASNAEAKSQQRGRKGRIPVMPGRNRRSSRGAAPSRARSRQLLASLRSTEAGVVPQTPSPR